ncbi:L-lactate dehydrogenase [Gracilibacillus boraciitolerans JCM 21714]|uniref:L-lactate dehydrogenase n=1 Tax=Gracilibacillus boraciitolerans JCM 21714 TaxID=1298598 RepID=W4VFD1_9BACI|nr:L-lactate dehydrogenase [Gracilibacillus boraciitolerans JCM 21714]
MPMHIGDKDFKKRVTKGIEDDFMRGAVRSAQGRLQDKRATAADELGDWEEWRTLGSEIRRHTIEHLDYYLHQLSEKVAELGGHVFFAETGAEANEYIQKVAKEKDAKKSQNPSQW